VSAREWIRALLDPTLPGAGPDTPRARPLAILLILGVISALAVARYEGFLAAPWQWPVHVGLGLGSCLAVVGLFHGFAPLRRVRARTWALVLLASAHLVAFWYVGRPPAFQRWLEPRLGLAGPAAAVARIWYLGLASLLFRLVLPFACAWLLLGLRPSALGLWARGNAAPPAVRLLWPVYVALFLAVLPFVVAAAETRGFQSTYPFARGIVHEGAVRADLLALSELAYLLVFLSGEAFWRGLWTFGTERDLGVYGVCLMIAPYVCVHYGKPLPETLGAGAAGLVLGWLALKHRSMWLGVATHYAVALSMDLLAIEARGIRWE